MKRKKGILSLLLLIALFGILQFIRPVPVEYERIKETKPLAGVPKEINEILKNSCFNCHSSSPQLAWYDKITPVNFVVNSHIQSGMEALNFSNWDSLALAKQRGILYYGLNKILTGEMPLSSYTFVHPSAKLKKEQISLIKDYLLSTSPRNITDSSQLKKSEQEYVNTLQSNKKEKEYNWVKPAPNGIDYIPGYRNWTAISTTDRFDNGTIRIIFANKEAVDAIRTKQTNPWPDGSILAKTLWKQEISPQGIVSTGEFIHVEYMIKDAKKYAATQGWGWARWKGDKLVPHGNTAIFVNECINCHKPVRNNDNVFTKPLNLKNLQKNWK